MDILYNSDIGCSFHPYVPLQGAKKIFLYALGDCAISLALPSIAALCFFRAEFR